MQKISVYIIAYNEAGKIADTINSVLWADEIVLADSASTDGTDRIAAEMGARIVQIPSAICATVPSPSVRMSGF
jgi:glycosyltransferase involved in cell wall biosynthesis